MTKIPYVRTPNRGGPKINLKLAREIRQKHIPWKYSMTKLGEEYGVSTRCIYDVLHHISHKEPNPSELGQDQEPCSLTPAFELSDIESTTLIELEQKLSTLEE